RGEGLIPRPSGAVIKVLNPRPIPFKNNIPRCSAAGYVDFHIICIFFANEEFPWYYRLMIGIFPAGKPSFNSPKSS
ncbi:MAG: hypothetical protein LBQ69_00545, partial [Treponema sp.]|nr:hypothetical protein [Treponema sp.]